MVSRKKCLVLGFFVFLWVELGIKGKEEIEEQICRLLGKFDLNGYVDVKNYLFVIGGLFDIYFRIILVNEFVLELVLVKCEG